MTGVATPSFRKWIAAASAVRNLRAARLGFLGHTYPGMLDMYSDFTQVHAQTGLHVEVLEIDDLVARVQAADEEAIARKGEEIREQFDPAFGNGMWIQAKQSSYSRIASSTDLHRFQSREQPSLSFI